MAEDALIPGLKAAPVHELYRAMDVLLEAEEGIQKAVFFATADLLNLEVDLLFVDTTSTDFETDEADAQDSEAQQYLRQYGHSGDHRPDRVQVVIGLAVTREGIPVRIWSWPGNTSDVSRVEEVKRDLVGWKLGRVVTVADRGFASEKNFRELQKAGGHYILGERLRSEKGQVHEALRRAGRYRKVRENLEVKEIVVGQGEARVRYVLGYNREEAERQRKERNRILHELRAELARIESLPKEEHTKGVCALTSHPLFSRYLVLEKGWPRLNRAKILEEEKLDGKYLLRTSDDTLSAEDVALGYKQLLQVEAAWRTLKQELAIRPVYHRLSRRIRIHVLLSWLALLLVRVAEVRLERKGRPMTWRRLRAELDRIHAVLLEGPSGRVRKTTQLGPERTALFDALGVQRPPLLLSAEPSPARKSA